MCRAPGAWRSSRDRRALSLGLAALLLVLASTPATARTSLSTAGATADAQLVPLPSVERHRVTYEPDEEEVYHQSGEEGRLDVTSEVARLGGQAGTVLLLPDDSQYRGDLGYRSEWQSDFYAQQGREYSYGVSYYLPEDWDQGESRAFDDRIIFQFHEGNGKSPTFSLHLDDSNDRFRLRHRDDRGNFEHFWSGAFETGRWYDFVFRVKWSKDDGFFQVYLDGRFMDEFRGPTLNDSARVYTKWGIYGQPTRLFVDEVRIVEGVEAMQEATPAHIARLLDAIPGQGIGLVRFTGGSSRDLVAASGCPSSARFWTAEDGRFVPYFPDALPVVNRAWDRLFANGIPGGAVLIATCDP